MPVVAVVDTRSSPASDYRYNPAAAHFCAYRRVSFRPNSAGLDRTRGLASREITLARARAAGAAEGHMIVGLGVDIAEIDRIEGAISRHGAAFLERLFTPTEIAYCERHKNKSERYAGRFAAKEAAMKALGTGWRGGVRWRDIEVTNLASGKPSLRLEGATRQIADRLGVKSISLSITHSGNLAFAEVIFEN